MQETKKTGAGFEKMRFTKTGLFVGPKCFFTSPQQMEWFIIFAVTSFLTAE